MAEQPQSTTRKPPVTLSLLRSSVYPETGPWTGVCTPDSEPREKEEWQVLLHSEARKDDGAG